MQYKNVIFDLDGTLIDSLADLAKSANLMLESYGFPTFGLSEYRYFLGNGSRTLVERILPPAMTADKSFVAAALARYKEIYAKHNADNTKPYDGIIPVLRDLAAMGLRLSVCTNKPQAHAEAMINTMLPGLPWQKIMGDVDGLPCKPHPAKVRLICESLNVPPEATAFVGDSAVDMETAVNGGCLPVGVLWGFRTKDELAAAGAKVIFANPSELSKIAEL